MRVLQGNAALLRCDEGILHRMGHTDTDVETDNAGRAFERVRGPHAGLELIGRRVIALERQQSSGQDLGLAFRFHVEQLEHRQAAQVVARARLRLKVWNNR